MDRRSHDLQAGDDGLDDGAKAAGAGEAATTSDSGAAQRRPRLRLYNASWCWYCQRVREKLDELGLDYEVIEVPVPFSQRREVIEVSGQPSVPVLVDGDVVLDDDDVIIPYLENKYGRKRS